MNRTLKIVIGLSAFILVSLTVLFILGIVLIRRSFTPYDGKVRVHFISEKVNIYRDSYGVPHIEATSEYDAYFAIGYVHAQDRLWQMELQRRAGLGRLAEVLGKDAVPIDRMFRTLGFTHLAHRLEAVLDPETRSALQAYADGVNEYIRIHKGHYPLEFDMLGYDPEPWTLTHSLLMSRLMAWELNYARWVDLTCAALVERVGYEMAREAFPYWEPSAPLIAQHQRTYSDALLAIRTLREGEEAYRTLLGTQTLATGSNAWVVSGTRTTTGKPILANDPHLMLMVPGRWYELHVHAPTFDVAGMTIPGVPFVVVGRNRSIAWGITNAMLDDADFYIETVDTLPNPTKYRTQTGWLPLRMREDTIFVKGEYPIVLTVYETERGPIVSNYEPGAKFIKGVVSIRWTGFETTNEPKAFYYLNRATTWDEFRKALRSFGSPAQNFVYADTAGTIGYIMAGIIPIRTYRGVTLPLVGWEEKNQWKGFVPFEQNPQVVNPPNGFLITANNKIVSDSYPYYLSSHWEPSWRAKRLWQCITQEPKLSPERMEAIQNDVHSLQAEEYIPLILRAFEGSEVHDRDLQRTLEYYRSWNFETRKEDVATTLFEVTHYFLLRNTFADEMGDELFNLYITLACTPITAMQRLLEQSTSSWFDDITTPQTETRDDIIRKSVLDALAYLRKNLGGDLKEWQWGRLHTVTFTHVLSSHPLLKKIFSVGPFEASGTHSTVNVGYYTLTNAFACSVGPSMRQVMNLADINDTRVIMPPGQSGQVYHQHYSDQVQQWLNGIYRTREMEMEVIRKSTTSLLVLEKEE